MEGVTGAREEPRSAPARCCASTPILEGALGAHGRLIGHPARPDHPAERGAALSVTEDGGLDGVLFLLARDEDRIRGYTFGFVTPNGTGYVHLIATRDDARGTGLGRRLYAALAETAERHGARQLKTITSIENTGSIAFHSTLGFDTKIVDDYNGPGRTMAVFHRVLPLHVSP
jgi:GNAT superfamily N-acetyltransferase